MLRGGKKYKTEAVLKRHVLNKHKGIKGIKKIVDFGYRVDGLR